LAKVNDANVTVFLLVSFNFPTKFR